MHICCCLSKLFTTDKLTLNVQELITVLFDATSLPDVHNGEISKLFNGSNKISHLLQISPQEPDTERFSYL
jgi:hypothetical protein